MKLLAAYKDARGFHYMVQIDETKSAFLKDDQGNDTLDLDLSNVRAFDWGPVPATEKTNGSANAPAWTEAAWMAMHQAEMKSLLASVDPLQVKTAPTNLSVKGATL